MSALDRLLAAAPIRHLDSADAVAELTALGRDEAHICAIHAVKLRGVASAMGYYCQLIPLTPDDYISEAGEQSIMSHTERKETEGA